MRTFLRTMITLVASLAVLTGLSAPQANAAVHNLCKEVGSYGCLAFSGYGPYTNTWADTRYYGGVHNCTRYVAYRLAKGGVPDQGTWGNAREWWHRAPGAKNNSPAVGAIAYWSSDWTSRHWGHSYGHVGVVEKVNADGSVEVTWDSYGDNINVRQVVSGNHLPTGYIHADNAAIKRSGGIVDTPPAPQPVKDGDTIAYKGHVYRIAGGAPIYVTNFDHVAGSRNVRAVNDAEWNKLRKYPQDGTIVRATKPGHKFTNSVFVIAGGAPIYVSNWDHIGGGKPYIDVDLDTIFRAGHEYPYDRLRARPANDTFLYAGGDGAVSSRTVYVVQGGAPIPVSDWNHIDGPRPLVTVDSRAIDNAGGEGAWQFLNKYPSDGTIIQGRKPGDPLHGTTYVMAGGAPIYISNWDNIGGEKTAYWVDLEAIKRAGTAPIWNNLRVTPIDGTQLKTYKTGQGYEVKAGVPIAQDASGEKAVTVDHVAIERAGQDAPYHHLKAKLKPAPKPDTPSGAASSEGGIIAGVIALIAVIAALVGLPALAGGTGLALPF